MGRLLSFKVELNLAYRRLDRVRPLSRNRRGIGSPGWDPQRVAILPLLHDIWWQLTTSSVSLIFAAIVVQWEHFNELPRSAE